MKVKQLTPNVKNPRVATSKKIASLKKTTREFGDISGIVFNRRSKQLISGHQRVKTFAPESDLTVTKKYAKPTSSGTVAEGFILSNGEKWAVRIVSWDDSKEKAAMIAANQGAGEWDKTMLGTLFRELDGDDFDLELTLFDEPEREEFFLSDDDESETAPKKKSKGNSAIMHTCPQCGHEFN